MPYTVTVSFGQNSEFEFKSLDPDVQHMTREEASRWLHQEYESLECAPRNPIGKILLLDVLLDVAKYAGAARFAAGGEWAQRFAQCCAAALKRDVRIDVPNFVVG
ncbi:MAG: hypothetical protein PHY45_09370 [Rhodocyclaceae bacterium]|nr:hypothetical protein [Rhodocyclaceae bacterium]